ncbi:hypothetical protein PG993_005840 [Apiospora rasikravindrae]|uniref:Uncharacterized protein n=1 Tax=Apiospora rasikravindrae TaxID=990691 RepID=A0ABR1T9X1_9PEZI
MGDNDFRRSFPSTSWSGTSKSATIASSAPTEYSDNSSAGTGATATKRPRFSRPINTAKAMKASLHETMNPHEKNNLKKNVFQPAQNPISIFLATSAAGHYSSPSTHPNTDSHDHVPSKLCVETESTPSVDLDTTNGHGHSPGLALVHHNTREPDARHHEHLIPVHRQDERVVQTAICSMQLDGNDPRSQAWPEACGYDNTNYGRSQHVGFVNKRLDMTAADDESIRHATANLNLYGNVQLSNKPQRIGETVFPNCRPMPICGEYHHNKNVGQGDQDIGLVLL